MRDRIEQALEQWAHFAYRHATAVILIVLAVVGASATQLPKITLDTSTEGFFHPDHPVRISYDEFRRQFGSDSLILIAIRPPAIFELGFLEKLRALHEELEAEVPMLVEVTSLLNVRETRGEGDELIVGELLEDWPETEAALAARRRVRRLRRETA